MVVAEVVAVVVNEELGPNAFLPNPVTAVATNFVGEPLHNVGVKDRK
jgi:hypothetical protein